MRSASDRVSTAVFFHQDSFWQGSDGHYYPALFPRAEGTSLLHEELYTAFSAALARHKPRVESDGIDWDHRRLAWLTWWTRWSLDNCEHPVIHHG